MLIVVVDTETSSLIKHNDINNFYILQLSWVFYNTITKVTEENDFILKVPLKYINNSHIHGITKIKSDKGYDFGEIINIFIEDVERCHRIVGYNLQYDLQSLEIELSRLNMWSEIDTIYEKDFKDPMKIYASKYNNNKYLKLTDLYFEFFGEELNGAHNALNNQRAT